MTRLEAWFYRRRVEWAVELLSANATARTEPEIPLARVLEWLLISSWESDGCIEFQRKARRGGKEHPSNWESVVVLAAARGENFQPGPTGPTRGNRSVGGTVTA